MRFTALSIALVSLTVTSASFIASPPLAARRELNTLLVRQDQVPIPTNLTNAQLETSYASQCSAINTATGQSAIQADIQAATSNSLAISQTFQAILNKLTFIDSENLNSGVLFAPTWSAMAQNWTNILWASRTTASNTAAYCTEFTTVIMPFVANLTGPIPPSLSVEVLDQYAAMAESLGAAAQATSEAFTALNNSINSFTFTFQNFAVKQKAADQQTIDQLNGDIAALQAQISVYNTELSALAAAIGVTALGTVSGVALFPEFAPFIIGFGIAAIAGEAAAYGVLETDRGNAMSKLNQDQAQVATLQNELAEIAAANSTLYSIDVATQTMGSQLGGFTAIWNAVVSDCTAVAQYLTDANSALDRAIPQIFWATTNNVNCVYQSMATGRALQYAIGIANSGLPSPTSRRALGGPADFAAKLHADVLALVAGARAKIQA